MLLYLSDGYVNGMLVWLIAGGVSFWLLLRLRAMWRDRPRRLNWVHAGLSTWMVLASLTCVELYFAPIYDASDSFNMTNVSKKWFCASRRAAAEKAGVSRRSRSRLSRRPKIP